MKRAYIDKSFKPATLEVIEQANAIIEDYQGRGYYLTLRQLYYQFVSRNWISNTERSYKRLGDILSNARLAGLVDWNAIVDRTRFTRQASSWDSPADIVRACANQFKLNPWDEQAHYCEVWIEKDALIDVIARPCQDLRVLHFGCKGYVSQSAQHEAAQRFIRQDNEGKACTLFYLGDHDPSGLDMDRDHDDRLLLFGCDIDFQRLALTAPQIQQYDPPPNPAKFTDSRAENYVRDHGEFSWELDALDVDVLDELVRSAIQGLVDETAWAKTMTQEAEHSSNIDLVARRWDDAVEAVR